MIHKINNSFAISSHGVWLPGSYESERAAKYAFRFSDSDLQSLQDEANKNPDYDKRIISFEMLQNLAKQRKSC